MNKKILVGLVLVVILIAAGSGYYMYNRTDTPLGDTDVKIEASALLAEFNQDEAAANLKYLDKVLEVSGTIKDVRDENDAFSIVLVGDDLGSVSCTLGKKDESDAHGVKTGDKIAIKGRCTGFLLDVVLIDCVIVHD